MQVQLSNSYALELPLPTLPLVLTSTHSASQCYNHHHSPDQLTVMTNLQADQSYL